MIPLLESEKQKAKGKKIEKYEEEETDENGSAEEPDGTVSEADAATH